LDIVETTDPSRATRDRIHVYVATQQPSYSETFVATEMRALAEQGEEVVTYSLREPPSDLETGLIQYLARPVPVRALFRHLPRAVGLWISVLRRTGRLNRRTYWRLLYAALHAARLSSSLDRHLRTHPTRHVVLHAHFLGRPADVVAMANIKRSTPHRVVTVHASDATDFGDRNLRRWRIARMQLFVCASQYVRTALTDVDPARTAIVHCGVDLSRIAVANRVGASPNDVRVCTIARLIPTKGHAEAYDFVRSLVRNGWSVRWDIVGDGPLRPWVRELAENIGGGLVIHDHGALPHAHALEILSEADVFLLLSQTSSQAEGDGIPVALMEAMALRVPVVTTPVGGIPELVEDSKTGIVVDAEDPEAALAGLLQVLRDEHTREGLLTRAYETVKANFEASSCAALLLRELDLITIEAPDARE
jgi:glycosyltransferase involved in cell wall biosynthesis